MLPAVIFIVLLGAVVGRHNNDSSERCNSPGLGVISYWDPSSKHYDTIPGGSLALINPNCGMFSSETSYKLVPNLAAYVGAVKRFNQRGTIVLGYVPTGYFNHAPGCNQPGVCQSWQRIEAQVAAYFNAMPTLDGIFFDEASPSNWNCSAFVSEYESLRQIVYSYAGRHAVIAFNAAIPNPCIVAAFRPDEIFVVYENSMASYEAQYDQVASTIAAADRAGVQTWLVVHSVTQARLRPLVHNATDIGATWLYATNIGGNWQAGENTYGGPPAYWQTEIDMLS
ncbi:unnamed protein product (mitochondrion) [Plasmodiophora brassicae]|uniref:Spherulation-specific family 4 n=1 Tax=Plasmodiophora brassicae TaxID=37360 RepID=A0A0G4J822_PLABS|nr:hypothetical protein PBRA_003312 [Plasmodiophora brassicae]SPQ99668.1 unnamed protein product [Plasmodiophora brassicae]